MSCSEIYNDYDGVQHDYTRKQGLVWEQVFLPPNAPAEWSDRSALWNAVEESEKTKDSRLAREFVVALPIELGKEDWTEILSDFIQEQFVSDGMCADVAIHDTDGHNPHAHIMLTVRPLDEQGKWQYKTEKEYLCVKDGEERGFTAAEFKTAQNDGWEKLYQYKVGKKKEYLPPSQAEGLERVNKYPKSTKYGRQNPITARWNSDEQLVLWRSAWADAVNRSLERSGIEERIDHRSNKERGLDEIPTIHEGVAARAMEAKGIVADRCELNRQIKKDNALIRSLKATILKLTKAFRDTLPGVADALETMRQTVILLCFHMNRAGRDSRNLRDRLPLYRKKLSDYFDIVGQIKEKSKERKAAQKEKQEAPVWRFQYKKELTTRIATLTEEIEELQSERKMLLESMDCKDGSQIPEIKKQADNLEKRLRALNQKTESLKQQSDSVLEQYDVAARDANNRFDPLAIYKVRKEIRPEKEDEIKDKLWDEYGPDYSLFMLADSTRQARDLLDEETEERWLERELREKERKQKQQDIPNQSKHKRDNWER